MTPMTHDPDKLEQEKSKELDKAKTSLVNCVLIELTDRTGNPQISQDPVLADKIERFWANVLVSLIPHAARVVQGGENFKVQENGSGWS